MAIVVQIHHSSAVPYVTIHLAKPPWQLVCVGAKKHLVTGTKI